MVSCMDAKPDCSTHCWGIAYACARANALRLEQDFGPKIVGAPASNPCFVVHVLSLVTGTFAVVTYSSVGCDTHIACTTLPP